MRERICVKKIQAQIGAGWWKGREKETQREKEKRSNACFGGPLIHLDGGRPSSFLWPVVLFYRPDSGPCPQEGF